ncbi:MAG: hypothetical protein ABIP39_05810 [Polyangiaceae bacterium]
MNVFLQTDLFRKAFNFKPETLMVDYRTAYSFYPGRIHVEGLALRGSDSAVQWILRIDQVDFSVSFLGLARRRFHASRIRANGLSMRLRLKSDDLSSDRLTALPEIPGFSDPPLREHRPPSPPPSDEDYKLWAINLEGVDAEHVREIWIDSLRFSGDSRVRGRWLFRPMRWLDVGPATIDLNGLDSGYGMIPLLTGTHGTVTATVHPFDVSASKGMKIFEHISADARFKGQAEVATTFATFIDPHDATFEHGEGPLDVRILLEHGVFAPGTHAVAESPGMEAHADDATFKASAKIELRVDDAAGKGRVGTFAVDLAEPDVTKPPAAAHARSARVELSTPSVGLVAPSFRGADFAASVLGAETASIAAWKKWLPHGEAVDVESGSLDADAHLEGSLSRMVAHGEIYFRSRQLALAHDVYRMTMEADGAVVLREASLGRADFSGSHVELHDPILHVKRMQAHADSLSVEAERAVIERQAAPDLELRARTSRIDVAALQGLQDLIPPKSGIVIRGGRATAAGSATYASRAGTLTANATAQVTSLSGRIKGVNVVVPSLTVRAPQVVVARAGPSGIVSVDLPRVDVPDLAALSRVTKPSKNFIVTRGTGQASMRFDVNLQNEAFDGVLTLGALGFQARIASESFAGDLILSLRAASHGPDIDLASTSLVFDGTDAGKTWWARLLFPEATMRLQSGFRFKSGLRLSAKDAAPLTRIVEEHSPIPSWLLHAIPTNDLNAVGYAYVTPASLELRAIEAHAGGVNVQMEYAHGVPANAAKDGAILIEYGPVHVGVDLKAEGSDVVLVSPERWFKERTEGLRSRPASW